MYNDVFQKFVMPLKAAGAEPFSLDSLIAWLETQNPVQKYDYFCTDGSCLIGQFMAHSGLSVKPGKYADYVYHWKQHNDFCVQNSIAHPKPWTFGAALSRARQYRASQP